MNTHSLTESLKQRRRDQAYGALGRLALFAALVVFAFFLLFVWRWQVVTVLFLASAVIANLASIAGRRRRSRLRHPVNR